MLELVQGLSNGNADISDSFEISFTGQGSVLQARHHVSRNEKEAAFSCCAVSCGESTLEEDLGQRLEVGSFNQQRLPHHTFLLTHLCSTIFKEERFCSLVFQTKKCWKGRVWM